jgi:hypothetical protein
MQRGRFVDLILCVICLGVLFPNFIFLNFKFQVKIQLHISCPHLGLVDLFIRCLLLSEQLSFIDHLDFFNNKYRPMISLKESTFVNEVINLKKNRALI